MAKRFTFDNDDKGIRDVRPKSSFRQESMKKPEWPDEDTMKHGNCQSIRGTRHD